MEDVFFKLQNLSKILFQWSMDNQMKANPYKCHFIFSANDLVNFEFAKLRALLAFPPYAPYAPYAPSCLRVLRALRALIFTRFNYAPCAPYSLAT